MAVDRARLTIDLEPRLHGKLKVIAARKGTTMRRYCVEAIEQRIEEEEPSQYLTAEEAPVLAELWDNPDDAIYDDL